VTLFAPSLVMASEVSPGASSGVTSARTVWPAATGPNPGSARVNTGVQGDRSPPSTIPSPFVSTSIQRSPPPPGSRPPPVPSTQLESVTGTMVPPLVPPTTCIRSDAPTMDPVTPARSNFRYAMSSGSSSTSRPGIAPWSHDASRPLPM